MEDSTAIHELNASNSLFGDDGVGLIEAYAHQNDTDDLFEPTIEDDDRVIPATHGPEMDAMAQQPRLSTP